MPLLSVTLSRLHAAWSSVSLALAEPRRPLLCPIITHSLHVSYAAHPVPFANVTSLHPLPKCVAHSRTGGVCGMLAYCISP